jgi:predicted MFS family arabinose efflux permease
MSDQTAAQASDTATRAHPRSTDASDPHAAPASDSQAWSSKPFRWLWAGSAVSVLGSEVGELAIPLLALISLDAGAGELSAMRTAQFAPFLVAALPLGLLVDRMRRLPLMIAADLGRFVSLTVLVALVLTGHGSVQLACSLLFVVGTLTVLYQSADFALLPHVVTRAQMTDANAKLSASYSAAEISGRGIGGLLVQLLSAPIAVLVNALGYVGSAVSLSRIHAEEPAFTQATGHPWRRVTQGFATAWRSPVLRGFLGGATVFNLAYEVFLLCVMLYLVADLDAAPPTVGAVLLCGGFGSLLGASIGPRLSSRYHYGRVLVATLALGNTAPLAVLLTVVVPGHEVLVMGASFLVMGVGIGISNAHVVTVRQIVAPEGMLGRVNSAYRFVSWGAIPVGASLGGLAAAALGPWAGMALGAGGLASATIFVVASPVRRLAVVECAVP